MKLITKQSDYAIRALLVLARHRGSFLSSAAIARDERIPLRFLRLILRSLAKEGMVAVKEGSAGGFALARPAAKLRLFDVVTLFQGPPSFTECLFRRKVCANRSLCPLRHRLAEIEHLVASEFGRITIGTLVADLERAQ